MNGFHGRILNVDLDARQFSIETVADDILKTCLGGKGLGSHLLYEKNPAGVDPLDGKNVLIFAAGSATGSAIWGGCRYGVFTKSPRRECIPSPTRATVFPKPSIRRASML